MGKLLSFHRKDQELTKLLKQAVIICKKSLMPKEGINIINPEEFKTAIEGKINQEIIDRRLISSDIFMCSIYVADLLTQVIKNTPKSWLATDYVLQYTQSGEKSLLKEGGDACFVICGLFPKKGNFRLMKIDYYQEMGISFYYQYFCQASKEIGYHMSQCFATMAKVVKSCLSPL